ncbi:MAG: 2-oxoacid:ferredoxin oxidoreductase subunit beta [Tepidisphaeraceae bacterium]|jgi:2-oxoglutarate ferredoxin oxidoreductase subunit beta
MTVANAEPITVLKPSDFASSQEIKWCPGCGDYAVIAQARKVLAKLGVARENTVFVSGIGCSSRFPYYMETYGFHSIHGRAPTLASGLKLSRPELAVWIITGDGDALSIGGNHFMHLIRRNLNVKIILFNNRIYGLTKGQYSPTSLPGLKTKTSPMGAPEFPVRPISLALGAESSFAARALDSDVKHLEYVIERAAKHVGTAFVEVYQNCVIFNDGAYNYISDKATRPDNMVYLEHGKPLIFGKNNEKAIKLKGFTPQIVNVADTRPEELLIHDEAAPDPAAAFLLSRLAYPEFPEPMGVFRAVRRETYDETVYAQKEKSEAARGKGDIQALLKGNETWTVAG